MKDLWDRIVAWRLREYGPDNGLAHLAFPLPLTYNDFPSPLSCERSLARFERPEGGAS